MSDLNSKLPKLPEGYLWGVDRNSVYLYKENTSRWRRLPVIGNLIEPGWIIEQAIYEENDYTEVSIEKAAAKIWSRRQRYGMYRGEKVVL